MMTQKGDNLRALEGERLHAALRDRLHQVWTLPLAGHSAPRSKIISSKVHPLACLCIVASNVAETSLTRPGMQYEVDTEAVKTKFYDCLLE